MKFGLLTEGEVPKGLSYSARYHEIIKEAVFAEEMGFDSGYFGTTFRSVCLRGLGAGNSLWGCCRANVEIDDPSHVSRDVAVQSPNSYRGAPGDARHSLQGATGIGHRTVEQHRVPQSLWRGSCDNTGGVPRNTRGGRAGTHGVAF